MVLGLAGEAGITARERNVSLSELYVANEVFTTATMGELAPVLEIDGRRIGAGSIGPVTRRLQGLYREKASREGEPLPF